MSKMINERFLSADVMISASSQVRMGNNFSFLLASSLPSPWIWFGGIYLSVEAANNWWPRPVNHWGNGWRREHPVSLFLGSKFAVKADSAPMSREGESQEIRPLSSSLPSCLIRVDEDGSFWHCCVLDSSGKAEFFWIRNNSSLFWDFNKEIDSHPDKNEVSFYSIYLIGVIRKVNLVENLGGFVLNGFHFYEMGRVLSGSIPAKQGEASATASSSTQSPFSSAWLNAEKGCELSLSQKLLPKYLLLVISNAYLDAVTWSGWWGLLVLYLRAFWSLWMQSAANGWCFRDCRNLWTWGRRMLLGGKRPVHNHSSSQPFSSLYLNEETSRREKVTYSMDMALFSGMGGWFSARREETR